MCTAESLLFVGWVLPPPAFFFRILCRGFSSQVPHVFMLFTRPVSFFLDKLLSSPPSRVKIYAGKIYPRTFPNVSILFFFFFFFLFPSAPRSATFSARPSHPFKLKARRIRFCLHAANLTPRHHAFFLAGYRFSRSPTDFALSFKNIHPSGVDRPRLKYSVSPFAFFLVCKRSALFLSTGGGLSLVLRFLP